MPAIETTIRVTTTHTLALNGASIEASIRRTDGKPGIFFRATETGRYNQGSALFALEPADAYALAGLLSALARDAEGSR